MTDIYGPIFVATDLENAVADTLRTWFADYLAEIALIRSSTVLPAPRSYNVRGEYDKWPEDQLPAVVVVSAGITNAPEREGDGTLTAPIALGIAIIAASNTIEGVNENIRTYAAAARAILLHKPPSDWVSSIELTSEGYNEGPSDAQRTMGTAIVEYEMYVPDFVNKHGGPAVPTPPDPDTLPGSSWPEVEETFVSVDLET